MIRRHDKPPKYSSSLDNLSLIEKVVIILLPILITFVDYHIIDAMFGLLWWVSLIISITFTITIMTLISLLVTFLIERYDI